MAKPPSTPVTIRVPSTIHAALSDAAEHLISSASALVRDYLILSHQTGALAAYLATRSGTPNPTGLTAPSAAPAAPHTTAPVRIERTPEEQAIYLDELFDTPEEKAAKAAARAAAKAPHTASTPAPRHGPSIQDLVDAANPQDWLWLDGSVPDETDLYQLISQYDNKPEEFEKYKAKLRKEQEYERQRANTLTPEQTLARIAEGMAAVRSQPGHGYIEPYVRVDHAPHREPLTADNSSQLPEPGTPAWVSMAERQGLPPEAIAEVVFATATEKVVPPVSGSFDFDAWGD